MPRPGRAATSAAAPFEHEELMVAAYRQRQVAITPA